MPKKIMLLTLDTFKSTGGIQNMTRRLAYALNRLTVEHNPDFQLLSLYDSNEDLNKKYLPAEKFYGSGGNRLSFFKKLRQAAKWPDLVIISHVNLSLAGLVIKLLNPKVKVWLVAHGIELWQDISPVKRALLKQCDKIVCVSEYTKQQVIQRHKVPADKCIVLNNTLDPFLTPPANFEKPPELLHRYGLNQDDKVLFTLTRINAAEQYKGYDLVIKAVAELKKDFPTLKYILSGKSDTTEKVRLVEMISTLHLENNIILTGFIEDKEINDHFLLADLFVMPSKGEGFGLVLIEAAACGTPVICGNKDGSVDAIKNGELGTAINPDDWVALIEAIKRQLQSKLEPEQKRSLQQKCLSYFNSNQYKEKLNQLIFND